MEKLIQKMGHLIAILLFTQFISVYAQSQDLQFQHLTTSDGLTTYWMGGSRMVQDAQGYLWIGTDAGLHKYDGYKFIVYSNNTKDKTSISSSGIRKLFCDSKGRLWISTSSGLNRWIPESENFERVYPDSNNIGKSGANGIWEIAEDATGNLWIAGRGLIKYNPETKTMRRYLHNPSDNKSISSDSIWTVFKDSKNTVWIGTTNGLNKFNPQNSDFTRYDLTKSKYNNSSNKVVSTISEDLSGRLLLGGGAHSLYYFDRKNEIIESLQNLKNNSIQIYAPKLTDHEIGAFAGMITSIFQSPSTKEYWISVGAAGINRFDNTGHFIRHYGNEQTEEHGLIDRTFTNIFEDKSNTLWIGTNDDGIYKATSAASNFLPSGYGMPKLDKLFNKHIMSVLEDGNNNLWLGTIDGYLYKYNIKSKSLSEYSSKSSNSRGLGKGDINFVFEDNKNNVWVGTRFGLSLYKPQSDTFLTYFIDSKKDDSNNFVGLSQDSAGNLIVYLWNWHESRTENYKFTPDKMIDNSFFKSFPDYNANLILKNNGGKLKYFYPNSATPYLPNISWASDIREDKNGIVWICSSAGLFGYNPVNNKVISLTTKEGLSVNTIGGMLIDDEDNFWIGTSAGVINLNSNYKNFVQFGKEDGLINNLFQTARAAFKSRSGLLYFGGLNGLTVIDPKRFHANSKKPYVQLTDIKIFGKSIPISKNGILNKSISVSDRIELDYNQNDLTIEYVGLHYKNSTKNRYAYKLEPYETEWNMVGEIRNARYTNLSTGKYTFNVKAANSDGIWNEDAKKLSIIINPPPWATWWAYTLYLLGFVSLLSGIRKFDLDRRREKENKKLLQLENDRKTKELEEARNLQLSMLPKVLPQLPNLDIAVYMKTATEVGGDYYDFQVGLDGTLIVAIGDATGHGMKAGTIVSMVKALFASGGSRLDMKTYFDQSSDALKGIELGRLMMAFMMLKIKSNKIEIANAGMPPLYIYRKQSKLIEEILIKGMPLGAIKDFPYEIREAEITPGDTLLLLSDGLPELRNEQNEHYGYNRVKEAFEKAAEKEPEEIINYMKGESSKWVNGKDPEDDVTFVVIKVK